MSLKTRIFFSEIACNCQSFSTLVQEKDGFHLKCRIQYAVCAFNMPYMYPLWSQCGVKEVSVLTMVTQLS